MASGYLAAGTRAWLASFSPWYMVLSNGDMATDLPALPGSSSRRGSMMHRRIRILRLGAESNLLIRRGGHLQVAYTATDVQCRCLMQRRKRSLDFSC